MGGSGRLFDHRDPWKVRELREGDMRMPARAFAAKGKMKRKERERESERTSSCFLAHPWATCAAIGRKRGRDDDWLPDQKPSESIDGWSFGRACLISPTKDSERETGVPFSFLSSLPLSLSPS